MSSGPPLNSESFSSSVISSKPFTSTSATETRSSNNNSNNIVKVSTRPLGIEGFYGSLSFVLDHIDCYESLIKSDKSIHDKENSKLKEFIQNSRHLGMLEEPKTLFYINIHYDGEFGRCRERFPLARIKTRSELEESLPSDSGDKRDFSSDLNSSSNNRLDCNLSYNPVFDAWNTISQLLRVAGKRRKKKARRNNRKVSKLETENTPASIDLDNMLLRSNSSLELDDEVICNGLGMASAIPKRKEKGVAPPSPIFQNQWHPVIYRCQKAVKNENWSDLETYLKAISDYVSDSFEEVTDVDDADDEDSKGTNLVKRKEYSANRFLRVLRLSSLDDVTFYMNQAYDRVVDRPELLNQYKGFSEQVYGETKGNLIHDLLEKHLPKQFQDPKEKAVFLDLGSGIGNVVLQVAAERPNWECYGIELMDIPNSLGQRLSMEFQARLSAYGLKHGKITLFHGDFLNDDRLLSILERVDLIFVNNYAFGPKINQALLERHVILLKEGARIVSFCNFVPLKRRRITMHSMNSIESILQIESIVRYPMGCVSWTTSGGEYYIQRVDRKHLEQWMEENTRSTGGSSSPNVVVARKQERIDGSGGDEKPRPLARRTTPLNSAKQKIAPETEDDSESDSSIVSASIKTNVMKKKSFVPAKDESIPERGDLTPNDGSGSPSLISNDEHSDDDSASDSEELDEDVIVKIPTAQKRKSVPAPSSSVKKVKTVKKPTIIDDDGDESEGGKELAEGKASGNETPPPEVIKKKRGRPPLKSTIAALAKAEKISKKKASAAAAASEKSVAKESETSEKNQPAVKSGVLNSKKSTVTKKSTTTAVKGNKEGDESSQPPVRILAKEMIANRKKAAAEQKSKLNSNMNVNTSSSAGSSKSPAQSTSNNNSTPSTPTLVSPTGVARPLPIYVLKNNASKISSPTVLKSPNESSPVSMNDLFNKNKPKSGARNPNETRGNNGVAEAPATNNQRQAEPILDEERARLEQIRHLEERQRQIQLSLELQEQQRILILQEQQKLQQMLFEQQQQLLRGSIGSIPTSSALGSTSQLIPAVTSQYQTMPIMAQYHNPAAMVHTIYDSPQLHSHGHQLNSHPQLNPQIAMQPRMNVHPQLNVHPIPQLNPLHSQLNVHQQHQIQQVPFIPQPTDHPGFHQQQANSPQTTNPNQPLPIPEVVSPPANTQPKENEPLTETKPVDTPNNDEKLKSPKGGSVESMLSQMIKECRNDTKGSNNRKRPGASEFFDPEDEDLAKEIAELQKSSVAQNSNNQDMVPAIEEAPKKAVESEVKKPEIGSPSTSRSYYSQGRPHSSFDDEKERPRPVDNRDTYRHSRHDDYHDDRRDSKYESTSRKPSVTYKEHPPYQSNHNKRDYEADRDRRPYSRSDDRDPISPGRRDSSYDRDSRAPRNYDKNHPSFDSGRRTDTSSSYRSPYHGSRGRGGDSRDRRESFSNGKSSYYKK